MKHCTDFTQHPFRAEFALNEAKRLLGQLDSLKLGKRSALAVQGRDPASWVRIWALARLSGRPFMPLSPYLDEQQTLRCLQAAGDAVLLRWDGRQQRIQLETKVDTASTPATLPSLALIVFTSGSEGEPRGVMHTAGGLQAACHGACERLEFGSHDLWLATLSPWHIGGIMTLERALYCGGEVMVLECFDPGQVARVWRHHPISHCSLVPSMLASLLDSSEARPPPSMRHALIGGAALPLRWQQEALTRHWPLCISYGLSEAASQVATRCRLSLADRVGNVGPLLSGMELKLNDLQDDIGRICLRGPMMMRGYLNPQRLPGQGLDHEGWFRSGDLGRWDVDGTLQIVGRCDDVIISGGVNVHPLPLERQLQHYPGIKEVAVVGVEDEHYGQLVTAVVTGDLQCEALLTWCREHIPSPQRPRRVLSIAEMPMLANGKIDRRQLCDWAGRILTDSAQQLD